MAGHEGLASEVDARLGPAAAGRRARSVESLDDTHTSEIVASAADAAKARLLWSVLTISALMFATEIVVGFVAQSTGLIANSLDMFATPDVAVACPAPRTANPTGLPGWRRLAKDCMLVVQRLRTDRRQ